MCACVCVHLCCTVVRVCVRERAIVQMSLALQDRGRQRWADDDAGEKKKAEEKEVERRGEVPWRSMEEIEIDDQDRASPDATLQESPPSL